MRYRRDTHIWSTLQYLNMGDKSGEKSPEKKLSRVDEQGRKSALRSSPFNESAGSSSGQASGTMVTMASNEMLMRKLLNESEEKQKVSFEVTLQKNMQPLRDELQAEREERIEGETHIKSRLSTLEEIMKTLQSSPPQASTKTESAEIVIGVFQGKSKQGAIAICEGIIRNQNGFPSIASDKVSNASEVVPIKFESIDAAKSFLLSHKDEKPFDEFWCNFSQTKEERERFRNTLQPLFKIKRALLETTTIRPEQVAINKGQKKIFMVDSHNLKFIAEVHSRTNVNWAGDVQEEVKNRYDILMQ